MRNSQQLIDKFPFHVQCETFFILFLFYHYKLKIIVNTYYCCDLKVSMMATTTHYLSMRDAPTGALSCFKRIGCVNDVIYVWLLLWTGLGSSGKHVRNTLQNIVTEGRLTVNCAFCN